MKDSIRSYELTLGGDRGGALKFEEKPAFRLGKQYATDLEDGAIFLWTGKHGRPEAAIQVFHVKNASEPRGLWIHEFTSLAPTTLTGLRSGQPWWAPTTPGLEFKPLPGAAKPAESMAHDPPDAEPWPKAFALGRLRGQGLVGTPATPHADRPVW